MIPRDDPPAAAFSSAGRRIASVPFPSRSVRRPLIRPTRKECLRSISGTSPLRRRLLVVGAALLAAGIAALPGCAYLAPGVSKAVTEERQAEIMERDLEIAEERVLPERRIADSLERIADAPERGATP